MDDNTEVEEDGEDLDTDVDGDDGIVLSAIEAAVARNNVKVREQMRKKGGKTSKVFEEKEIATLAIPRKMRLNIESSRLAVRIVDENSNGYKLLSRHGLLKGRYQGGELNKVDGATSEVLGRQIPFIPLMNRNKPITKSLAEAIQLENNRPSISALQKAGRKKGKGKGKEKEITQAESSTSGIGNSENPIFVECSEDLESQGLDSSSQVWYSCPEEEDSQEETPPHHYQVRYQGEDQDYYLHYTSQDENNLENGNEDDDLNSHLENQDSEIPMSTPIHQSSQIRHLSRRIQAESTPPRPISKPKTRVPPHPPISKPKSLSKTQAQAAPKRRTPRTAAKRAASAISEMAIVMPISKRRRK